ncbi:MAG: SMC-Scp complex subunit ScpB [Rothia sp. (in: high G+C Gram-positive bacteria)]|uniref:SMC-Scp complex subunit ScpB n=1 Tax=Rothia sp. (in: high G+C Gram-positive bacteria) TaxID=1885016 RepID=UPI0026E03007|nr:SMC-Scp complex subunit ScpB [Rothia sp. (in: high G+C Gram-positive bacteria)]MDO5751017.1 SMC-Scp complex subunit ScpB [Rothia sp. (in: high G+C Gram-positive bacteria)]
MSGERFEDQFTPDDLDIILGGSWGAEDEPVEETAEPVSETIADSAESEPAPEPEEADIVRASLPKSASRTSAKQEPQQAVPADSDDEFARVERIPGGVKSAIEAILAVADTPVSVREFAAALIVPERRIEAALDELVREYNGDSDSEDPHKAEPRGYELRQIAGGWRLYSRAEFSPWVARFVTRSHSAKLTRAELETLAVIAYQQPVSRSAMSAVRGTSANAAVRKLLQRQLIREAGKEGGTMLYETTELLLTKLGLESLEQLPELAPLLPDETEASVLAEGTERSGAPDTLDS